MERTEARTALEDQIDRRSWLRFAGILLGSLGIAAAVAGLIGRDGRDRLLLFAAGVLGLIGIIHSVLGERYVLLRIFRRGPLPRLLGSAAFAKGTVRMAWHLTTVSWWGLAALLLTTRRGADPEAVLITTAGVAAVSAVMAAVGTRLRHPAWVAFASVAVAVWLAATATR